MKYFLSADGGGTKLLSILYDENYRLCGVGRSGSVNVNFESRENVRKNMEASVGRCLEEAGVRELSCVSVSGPLPQELYREVLSARAQTVGWEDIGEGNMALYAGAFTEQGILALSGTGSDVFSIDGGEVFMVGGWGGLVDDEGSGYDIGRAGIAAAIKASDGRGPQTMLTGLVLKKFGVEKLWDIVPKIYVPNYREAISGVCPLVADAAEAGDAAAAAILKNAGEKLAEQVLAVKRLRPTPDDRAVVIAGSAWKGPSVMYDSFRNAVHARFPAAPVARPAFVPVMGGVVRRAIRRGDWSAELEAFLRREYAAFLYDKETPNV